MTWVLYKWNTWTLNCHTLCKTGFVQCIKGRKLRLCIRKCSMHILWMGLGWGHVIVGRLLHCERCCGSHVPTDRVLMVGSTYCKQQYQHIHHWKHSATRQFFTSITFDTSWFVVPVTKDLISSDCFNPISDISTAKRRKAKISEWKILDASHLSENSW